MPEKLTGWLLLLWRTDKNFQIFKKKKVSSTSPHIKEPMFTEKQDERCFKVFT
jgi:hypothetical protein